MAVPLGGVKIGTPKTVTIIKNGTVWFYSGEMHLKVLGFPVISVCGLNFTTLCCNEITQHACGKDRRKNKRTPKTVTIIILKMVLKVGSWSFECITILQIYFLNCWKTLFTRNT